MAFGHHASPEDFFPTAASDEHGSHNGRVTGVRPLFHYRVLFRA